MELNKTTWETILDDQYEVSWYLHRSKYWAATTFEGETIWGSGLCQEDALSCLIEHIEYLDSGEGAESHDGWCDLG